jgi:hypothetical protein
MAAKRFSPALEITGRFPFLHAFLRLPRDAPAASSAGCSTVATARGVWIRVRARWGMPIRSTPRRHSRSAGPR